MTKSDNFIAAKIYAIQEMLFAIRIFLSFLLKKNQAFSGRGVAASLQVLNK